MANRKSDNAKMNSSEYIKGDSDYVNGCSICGVKAHAKGLCSRHYYSLRAYGDANVVDQRAKGKGKGSKCLLCNRPVNSKGYCKKHYDEIFRKRQPCVMKPCQGRAVTKGMCRYHSVGGLGPCGCRSCRSNLGKNSQGRDSLACIYVVSVEGAEWLKIGIGVLNHLGKSRRLMDHQNKGAVVLYSHSGLKRFQYADVEESVLMGTRETMNIHVDPSVYPFSGGMSETRDIMFQDEIIEMTKGLLSQYEVEL